MAYLKKRSPEKSAGALWKGNKLKLSAVNYGESSIRKEI
jgi:hypothetical protein